MSQTKCNIQHVANNNLTSKIYLLVSLISGGSLRAWHQYVVSLSLGIVTYNKKYIEQEKRSCVYVTHKYLTLFMAMIKESASGGGGGGLLSPPRRLILVLPLNSCLMTLSALTGSLECQPHTTRDVSVWMINNVRCVYCWIKSATILVSSDCATYKDIKIFRITGCDTSSEAQDGVATLFFSKL